MKITTAAASLGGPKAAAKDKLQLPIGRHGRGMPLHGRGTSLLGGGKIGDAEAGLQLDLPISACAEWRAACYECVLGGCVHWEARRAEPAGSVAGLGRAGRSSSMRRYMCCTSCHALAHALTRAPGRKRDGSGGMASLLDARGSGGVGSALDLGLAAAGLGDGLRCVCVGVCHVCGRDRWHMCVWSLRGAHV